MFGLRDGTLPSILHMHAWHAMAIASVVIILHILIQEIDSYPFFTRTCITAVDYTLQEEYNSLQYTCTLHVYIWASIYIYAGLVSKVFIQYVSKSLEAAGFSALHYSFII